MISGYGNNLAELCCPFAIFKVARKCPQTAGSDQVKSSYTIQIIARCWARATSFPSLKLDCGESIRLFEGCNWNLDNRAHDATQFCCQTCAHCVGKRRHGWWHYSAYVYTNASVRGGDPPYVLQRISKSCQRVTLVLSSWIRMPLMRSVESIAIVN